MPSPCSAEGSEGAEGFAAGGCDHSGAKRSLQPQGFGGAETLGPRRPQAGVQLGQGYFFPMCSPVPTQVLRGERSVPERTFWGRRRTGIWEVWRPTGWRGAGSPPPLRPALLFLASTQGQQGGFLRKWTLMKAPPHHPLQCGQATPAPSPTGPPRPSGPQLPGRPPPLPTSVPPAHLWMWGDQGPWPPGLH